jgi:hypothetical protein
MSYCGFIQPVNADGVREIENLAIDELKQYMLTQKMKDVDKKNYTPDFFDVLNVIGKVHSDRSVYMAGWFPAFERCCEMGKPLFNKPETQRQFSYFKPFVTGTTGIQFLQSVFEESMLSSESKKEQEYFRIIFHELLEVERGNDLFLIYGE